MKKILLALIISVGVSSSASAQLFVAADGGIAPDGSVNYVFPGGFPFQSRGSLYPMPQQYWVNPVQSSNQMSRSQAPKAFIPIPREQ